MAATWDFTQIAGDLGYAPSYTSSLSSLAQVVTLTGFNPKGQQVALHCNGPAGVGLAGSGGEIPPGGWITIDVSQLSTNTLGSQVLSVMVTHPSNAGSLSSGWGTGAAFTVFGSPSSLPTNKFLLGGMTQLLQSSSATQETSAASLGAVISSNKTLYVTPSLAVGPTVVSCLSSVTASSAFNAAGGGSSLAQYISGTILPMLGCTLTTLVSS